MKRAVLLLALLGACSQAQAQGPVRLGASSGFLISAEQRFDPVVQRLLAERSLDALPLANGRLFYILPARLDTREQQDQIRYLEFLLDKRAKDAKDSEDTAPAQP